MFTDILTGRIKLVRQSSNSVDELGQPIHTETTVYASLPIRFYAKSGKIVMKPGGQERVARYMIMTAPGMDIRENDFMYALSGVTGLTIGVLEFVRQIYDFNGLSHHMEADVKEI